MPAGDSETWEMSWLLMVNTHSLVSGFMGCFSLPEDGISTFLLDQAGFSLDSNVYVYVHVTFSAWWSSIADVLAR